MKNANPRKAHSEPLAPISDLCNGLGSLIAIYDGAPVVE